MTTQSSTGHRPGDRIPEVGIYECEGNAEHTFEATTLGEFPPLPEGCESGGWVLVKRGPIGPGGFSAEEVAGAPES
jgi:hypothetical protein